MKILPALLLAGIVQWPLLVGAADYLADFNRVKAGGSEKEMAQFLAASAKPQMDNADYYATAGNHWWQLSQQVNIKAESAEGGVYSLRDADSDEVVGSITTTGHANPELPKRAVELLAEGARRFPKRVDIVLGLAHVQREMGKQKACVDTLLRLISTAKKDPEGLLWTRNAPIPSPAAFMIPEAIQKYSTDLYRDETPASDALCIKLCEATISAYPNHPYAYNVRAAVAAAQGQPEESLRYLERASAKAPHDALILMNLGDGYARLDQPAKAKEAFTKVLKMAEAEDAVKEQAQHALDQIEDQSLIPKPSQPKPKIK